MQTNMDHEKLYKEIIDNLCDGVYFVDMNRRITFWNKAAENITGYKKEDILGKCCQHNLLNHIDKNGTQLCLYGCPLYATLVDGRQRKDNVFLRHISGYRIPITVNIFPMMDNGVIIGAIEIFTPNSQAVYDDTLIENLSNLAMNDPLTGLANRRKIESYLTYRLNEMKRFNNKFCLIFLDIDNFRYFNNTYGHEVGDGAIKSIAKSIKHIIKKNDLFGRWGGEEFVGVFEINNDFEAVLIAEKIRMLISRSEIIYKKESLAITASIGVTIAKEDDTIETLIKRADLLMYQSKQKNKNCVTSDT